MTTKNTFKNNQEPSKGFKPTPKAIMVKTTGRDCTEYTVRNVPHFEVDLKTTRTSNIAFMHTLIKAEKRPF